MTYEAKRGSTFKLTHVFYSYWSGQEATSIRANLAGATIKTYVKNRDTDSDAAGILTINGTVTDSVNGLGETPFAASDTNTLSYSKLVCETVAKLADGSYVRPIEVDYLILNPNVGKTLF